MRIKKKQYRLLTEEAFVDMTEILHGIGGINEAVRRLCGTGYEKVGIDVCTYLSEMQEAIGDFLNTCAVVYKRDTNKENKENKNG